MVHPGVLSVRDRVEAFVASRLEEAGVWRTRREADGIRELTRQGEGTTRARFRGALWTIDQEARLFWLDLHVDDSGRVAWDLCFDLVASPRRLRAGIHAVRSPEHESWRVRLEGRYEPCASAATSREPPRHPERGDAIPAAIHRRTAR